MSPYIIPVTTTLTLISHVLFVLFLLAFTFDSGLRQKVYGYVETYILYFIFLVSLVGVGASLLYSHVLGFPPCELCWVQRIFLYPQAIISFLAILRKDKGIVIYLLPLSVLGVLVSIYQSLANFGIGSALLECTSQGGACSKVYVLEYGYITIPIMALTTFAYLIAISVVYFRSRKSLSFLAS